MDGFNLKMCNFVNVASKCIRIPYRNFNVYFYHKIYLAIPLTKKNAKVYPFVLKQSPEQREVIKIGGGVGKKIKELLGALEYRFSRCV